MTAYLVNKDYSFKNKILEKIRAAEEFQIILNPSKDLLEITLKFRFLMSQEIYGKYGIKIAKEIDKYDAHSLYCVTEKKGEVAGVCRLVLGQQENPKHCFQFQDDKTDVHFYEWFSYNTLPIENLALASRLYVLHHYRGSGAFLSLFKGRFRLCAQKNISYLFSEIRQPLSEKYKEYGLNFTQVSNFYNYFGTQEAIYFRTVF